MVANGTYHLSASGEKQADSLWIGGDAYVNRTRPLTVRAETVGGVTFDGTGETGAYGGLSFEDGAHDQTWDGFNFANMKVEYTGVMEVGGYLPRRTPYNITLRNMTVSRRARGRATTSSGSTWDHGVYLAHAVGVGPHDILIENLTVDGRGNLASAVHWDHGDAANPPTWNVTVRGLHVTGTQSAIIPWVDGLHDITIDGADIADTKAYGVYFESNGASRIVLKNITSVRSRQSRLLQLDGHQPAGRDVHERQPPVTGRRRA